MTLREVLYRLNRNKLTILGLAAAVLAGIEAGDGLVSIALGAVTLLQRQLVTPANEVILTTNDVVPGSLVEVTPPAPAPEVPEAPAIDPGSYL